MEANSPTEKPLSPGAKAALMGGAATTILLYYSLTLLGIGFLAGLVLIEIVLVLTPLQIVLIQVANRHAVLLTIFLQSFRQRKWVDFRLLLEEKDAPELFHSLRTLADRLQINPPQVVQLEMSVGAWVQLKGLRQGKGKTILGVGYDLLAGLSKPEMEAVLAHEMAHAKLVQRGLTGWLSNGLNRLINLTNRLGAESDAYQRAGKKNWLADVLWKGAHRLTRLAASQVSAYSRQDEFEADRGAAELSGSAAIRSALLKLDRLYEITSRLPWRERVARLQLEGGLSQWLQQELTQADTLPQKERAEVFNKYSTHPLLKDRLAALPADDSSLPTVLRPATELLANPEEVASKLVLEIQRRQAELEQTDTKEVQKWLRKTQGSTRIEPLQVVALPLIVLGGGAFLIALVDGVYSLKGLLGATVSVGAGIYLFRKGVYRDKTPLPVPTFTAFMEHWRKMSELKDTSEVVKSLEEECTQLAAQQKRAKKKIRLWISESYAALESGDYLRAHVMARACILKDNRNIEALMGLSIASAALSMFQQTTDMLRALKQNTGLKSTESLWAAAWSLVLAGDWLPAEGFLEQALKKRPEEPTWRMLLAFVLARRGKLQGAIKNAREAFELRPWDAEGAKLFINLLIESGYFREAQERLDSVREKLKDDPEFMLAQVRALLLQQKVEPATEWAERLKETAPHGQMIVHLGEIYEEARQYGYASGCYNRALDKGYYPAAYVGLGRVEAQRSNHDVATAYFLSALEFNRSLGANAVGPQGVFNEAVGRLVMLREPMLNCRAWVVKLAESIQPTALANQSFMIYAPERAIAEKYFDTLLGAVSKGMPPVLPGHLTWREGTAQQQPDGPVRPGVQGIFT